MLKVRSARHRDSLPTAPPQPQTPSPRLFFTPAHVRRRRCSRLSREPFRLPLRLRPSSDSQYPTGQDRSTCGDLELASMLLTAMFPTDRRRHHSGSHGHGSRQYESVRACSKAAGPGPGGGSAGPVGKCLDGAGGSTASHCVPWRALAEGARAWQRARGRGRRPGASYSAWGELWFMHAACGSTDT